MRSREIKVKRYNQRKRELEPKLSGTDIRPRLSVFRSNAHIYAQIINDDKGITLVASSDVKTKGDKITKTRNSRSGWRGDCQKGISQKNKNCSF